MFVMDHFITCMHITRSVQGFSPTHQKIIHKCAVCYFFFMYSWSEMFPVQISNILADIFINHFINSKLINKLSNVQKLNEIKRIQSVPMTYVLALFTHTETWDIERLQTAAGSFCNSNCCTFKLFKSFFSYVTLMAS